MAVCVSVSVCVWLVCGGVGARVEVVCCCSLCVSDLGGFGLGRKGVFAKSHGPEGKKLLKVGAGLWWWTWHCIFRVGG